MDKLFWFEVYYNEDIVVINEYDEDIVRIIDSYYVTAEQRWFLKSSLHEEPIYDEYTEEDIHYQIMKGSFVYEDGDDVEIKKEKIKKICKDKIREILSEKQNEIQRQIHKLN